MRPDNEKPSSSGDKKVRKRIHNLRTLDNGLINDTKQAMSKGLLPEFKGEKDQCEIAKNPLSRNRAASARLRDTIEVVTQRSFLVVSGIKHELENLPVRLQLEPQSVRTGAKN